MKTMKAFAALGVLLACVPVLATPLPPNTSLTKPGVGLSAPNYASGLPSYFTPGNLVQTLSAPMSIDFAGTVTTQVYSNNVGGFTFAYTFRNNSSAMSGPDMVRATFSPVNWNTVTVTAAGADGSGTSTPGGAAPAWRDGDPYLIGRADAGSLAYPFFQWRVGNAGTTIGPGGNGSAVVWLETTTATIATGSVGLSDGGAIGKASVLVPIPAPAAVMLGMLGLGMIGWVRRRSR